MIAEMEVSYQATRLLMLNAAQEIDRGNLRGTHSACAKVYGADAAMKVTTDCVQVFGDTVIPTSIFLRSLCGMQNSFRFMKEPHNQRVVIAGDLVRHAS